MQRGGWSGVGFVIVSVCVGAAACSDEEGRHESTEPDGFDASATVGGAPGAGGLRTGGATSSGAGGLRTGGATGTGGALSAGGATGTGGTLSAGGAVGAGGTLDAGGAPTAGGASNTGGVLTSGGALNAGGASGASGADGGTATGGSSQGTGGSAADGGSVQDAGDAAESGPPVETIVTLETDPFELAPGGEVYKCQNFANPFQGHDVAVVESSSVVVSGYRVFVFREADAESTPLQDCEGVELKEFIHFAHGGTETIAYPSGVGNPLNGSLGLRILTHHVNRGAAPVTARTTLTLHAVDASAVTAHAAGISLNRIGLSVRGGQSVSTSAFQMPFDVELLRLGGHMHAHGEHFVAETETGVVLVDSNAGDAPPSTFVPPVHLSRGSRLTWRCTYDNPTGHTLTFGPWLDTNEMCLVVGFYQGPPGAPRIHAEILF